MEVGFWRGLQTFIQCCRDSIICTLCSLGVSSALDILICIVCFEELEVDLVTFQTID